MEKNKEAPLMSTSETAAFAERQKAKHRSFHKDWTVMVNTGLRTAKTHSVRACTAHAAMQAVAALGANTEDITLVREDALVIEDNQKARPVFFDRGDGSKLIRNLLSSATWLSQPELRLGFCQQTDPVYFGRRFAAQKKVADVDVFK